MSPPTSRRRLLQAALLAPVVAACTPKADRPASIDPDVALRAAAVARERALIGHYRAAAASSSSAVAARIAGLAEQHEQHLAALGLRSPEPSPRPSHGPSTTPAPPPPQVPTLPQLAAAERTAAADHAAAALQASRPLAAVLASLAASEASHAAVLL